MEKEKEEKEVKEEEKVSKRKKKKSNKVITTLLIVLLLIAFIGIGFAIGSTQLLKEYSKKVSDNGINEEPQNLSILDKMVTDSIKDFNQLGFDPRESYESDITNITRKGLIITALKGLKNEQINYCVAYESELKTAITIEDLNNILKDVIPDGKITIDDIKNNKNETTSYSVGGYGYTFEYANGGKEEYSIKIDNDKLYIVGPCGHEGPTASNISTQVEKAELYELILEVYVKVAYGKLSNEANLDSLVYEYYKEKDFTQKVETIALDMEPTWNQYNTYKITFRKNGNKYYFDNSEKWSVDK